MPCAVLCIPEAHMEKCEAQWETLKKRVKDMKFEVAYKPIDAMEKGNKLAEREPTKKCSLFIIHSKFFNITKDPFCATLFKSLERQKICSFACGKHSACDKIGKKFHWFMGEDGDWNLKEAVSNMEKLMDGQFTECGFKGKPLRKSMSNAGEIAAIGGQNVMSPMMMSMGGMGSMGGMNANMMPMGTGMMGNMAGVGAMAGGMGGMGMMGTMGTGMGGMGSGMGTLSGSGRLSGGLGNMSGGIGAKQMEMGRGSVSGPLSGNGSFTSGSGPLVGSVTGLGIPNPEAHPLSDILTETETMISQGVPMADVVKMLANEVQRLSTIVQGRTS